MSLKSGSKIGIHADTASSYGILGGFIQRGDSTYILTNGHIVNWSVGTQVYCYDTGTPVLIGEVERTTTCPGDVEEGLDAAAVLIQNPEKWNIDCTFSPYEFQLKGVKKPTDGMKLLLQGAKSGYIDDASVRDDDGRTVIEGHDKEKIHVEHAVIIGFKRGGKDADTGDSGSLLVSKDDHYAVALFNAHASDGKTEGVACDLTRVLTCLSKDNPGVPFTLKTN
eukprot:GFUD01030270.1.p1 GENE.GFUD01030270.1~~GFUD01030270.1.p1  ORF type:complete len:223 (-),score=60.68 GFUD01030270.1:235-903(-)